jgi:hypothetical protein
MSHFTVLVIGDNIEGKLAPYSEQLEVEPYKRYINKEERKRMAEYYGVDVEDAEALIAKMPSWSGCEGSVDENGLYYLTTHNPKSKWDWHQIGGRWAGSFVLKDGVRSKQVLDPSWIWKKEEVEALIKEGRTDQARFGDIDWEKTQQPAPEELKRMNKFWDWVEGKLSKEEAKEQNIIALYKPEYYLERYYTREEYIRRQTLFGTYAVVTEDGEWHEPGKMGWWGISTATPGGEEDWNLNYFDRFLKGLNPDTLLTVVDCHI